jgi:ankyrin repeat protein
LGQNAEPLLSFRWVECQLEALCHCPTAIAIKMTLETLPPSLEKTYERTLSRIRPEHKQYVKRALYLLCFSHKPLSQPVFVSEVAEFAVIDPQYNTFDRNQQFYDPDDILEYCSGLIYVVPVSKDVRLAHSSVKEYLLSAQIRQSSAASFSMTKQEAQNALVESCLIYLMTFGGSKTMLADHYKDFPFLPYDIDNWHRHITHEQNPEGHDLDAKILHFLDSGSNEAFLNWPGTFEPELFLDEDYAPSQHLWSPFYIMTHFKCYEIIPLLAADTGSCHSHGRACGPALALAMHCQDIELLEILIHCGCDLSCQLENGESIPAYSARRSSSKVIRVLLEAGMETAATKSSPSMLMVAIVHRQEDLIDLLLEDGADVFELDATFSTVLHAAVCYQPIRSCVFLPSLRIIKALLTWGASPDTCSENHGSVMHAAMASFPSGAPTSQLIEITRMLLNAGADPNIRGGQYGCALQVLMSLWIPNEHKQLLFDLLVAKGARISLRGGFYGTILQAAAASNTSKKLARSVLGSEEDLNDLTGFYGTALQAASYANNIPVLMLLLNTGVEVNTRGGYCGSALQAACYSDGSDDLQLVKALLDHGANVNAPATAKNVSSAGTPLQIAASRGKHDLVQLLLENGAEVNAIGTALGPALHACLLGNQFGVSKNGIRSVALLLIASGADVNQQGGSYDAPIIAAAALGDHEILKMLTGAGADVNVVARESRTTALHVAAAHAYAGKAIEVLLSSGAVVGPKDGEGRTAIDVACLGGNINATNLLIGAQETVGSLEN